MITLFLIGFRYITWWLARVLGYIYRFLANSWLRALYWLVIVAAGLWFAEWLAIRFNLFNVKTGTWFQVGYILAIYALVVLLRYGWKARKQVVIEEFIDYTGTASDSSKSIAKGLSTLLVSKFAQLRELYQAVDEQRAIPMNIGVELSLDPTINVEDVSGFLKGAATPDSKLSIGPIAIPIGNLMSFISRLIQGTRIIGNLHRVSIDGKDFLVLTAQRVGGKKPYSWRVDRAIISPAKEGGQEKYSLDDMVTELAYRILADLELKGTTRWEAVAAFSEGLQAYHEGLRTPRDRKLKLKQAERKLIVASAEDEEFAMANYNLGVVYSELDQVQATEVAFLDVIQKNPRAWRAYYALMVSRVWVLGHSQKELITKGTTSILPQEKKSSEILVSHYQQQQNESVISLCERILALNPPSIDRAKTYHWMGIAQRQLNDQRKLRDLAYLEGIDPQDREVLRENIHQYYLFNLKTTKRIRKKSITQAWKALWVAKFLQRARGKSALGAISLQETVASICIADLAAAYIYQAQAYEEQPKSIGLTRLFALFHRYTIFRNAELLYQQALFLNRSNAELYYIASDMYYRWGKYADAIIGAEKATRINPAVGKFWALLALNYALDKNEEAAIRAYEKVFDFAHEAFNNRDMEVFNLAEKAHAQLSKVGQTKYRGDIFNFLDQLSKYKDQSQFAFSDSPPNKQYGESAINALEESLKNYDLYFQVQAREYAQAWEYAQTAITLGQVYLEHDSKSVDAAKAQIYFQNAIVKLQDAHPQVIRSQNLWASYVNSLLRQRNYDEALQVAEEALALDPLNYAVREVLGNVYYRLNEFEKAIAPLEEALLQNPDELNIFSLLGFSYVQLFFGCRSQDQRISYYQQAVTCLKKTLVLCQSDQQDLKGRINNFLARLHLDFGKHKEAISCFKISRILKFAPLSSKYYLGCAYLKNKHYDQSMKEFNSLRQLDEQDYSGNKTETMSFDEISVMTLWGIAFNYAERDVSLTEALKLIEEAQKNIQPSMGDVKANCLDCKGWILLKQSWVDNQPDKVDEAIVCLKEALALHSDALFYLHLALAYEQKLQTSLDDAQFQALDHLVKIYSQHAQELDLNNEFEQPLTNLSTRLEQKRKEKQQKSSQDHELSKPTTNGH